MISHWSAGPLECPLPVNLTARWSKTDKTCFLVLSVLTLKIFPLRGDLVGKGKERKPSEKLKQDNIVDF